MSQYYLLSQLPSLDGLAASSPLPITEARFNELCNRFLGKKELHLLNSLSLSPLREVSETKNALIDAWNGAERSLRLALGTIRANKLNKEFDAGVENIPAEQMQAAKTAVEMDDPLQAEIFLNDFRLAFLETLRPLDCFSDNVIYYYALKLKLTSRLRGFNQEIGKNAYQNIYNSIIQDGKGGVENE